MSRTIDEIMDLDPLELTPEDIDMVIINHRNHRAHMEGGGKVEKEKGPKIAISLADLGLVKAKPEAPPIRRRL